MNKLYFISIYTIVKMYWNYLMFSIKISTHFDGVKLKILQSCIGFEFLLSYFSSKCFKLCTIILKFYIIFEGLGTDKKGGWLGPWVHRKQKYTESLEVLQISTLFYYLICIYSIEYPIVKMGWTLNK